MARDSMFRIRHREDGSAAYLRFTGSVVVELEIERKRFAELVDGNRLNEWRPPEQPCWAWIEFMFEVTGHLTRGLRLWFGPSDVAEKERLAMAHNEAAEVIGAETVPGNFFDL